jgi:two-component system OmpR family sensor kinase
LRRLPPRRAFAVEAVLAFAAAAGGAALLGAATAGPDYLSGRVVLLLQMVTAGLAAGVWLVCTGAARIRESRRTLVTIAGAWAFYGFCVMPLGVLHTSTVDPAIGAGAFGAALAFLLLLAAGLAEVRTRWAPGAWGFGIAAVVTAVAIAGATVLPDSVGALFSSTVPDTVIGASWVLLACAYTLRGWHNRDVLVWRMGLGLAVVAAAHLDRFALGGAESQLVVLRLSGLFLLAFGVGMYVRTTGRSIGAERNHDQELAATTAHAHERRDHEMRNALTNLAALPHLIDSGIDRDESGERTEIARLLSAELRRLEHLLSEDPERPGDHTATVDLVLIRLVTLRRAAGKTITLDCPGELVADIPTATLTQVVTNLLVNCDRYAPGSPVHITARREDQRCVVEVTDAGPGPARELDAKPVGHGLGLALASQLVGRHNGTLALLAAPLGKTGCTARVELPLPRTHIPDFHLVPGAAWRAREAS